MTVRGSANIFVCLSLIAAQPLTTDAVLLRVPHRKQERAHPRHGLDAGSAVGGAHARFACMAHPLLQSVLCLAVSGGSTQSVEQSRKRQVPSGSGTVAAKRASKRSPSPPPVVGPLPVVSAQQDLAALQKLLRCGQWSEFDQQIPCLRSFVNGPCALQAQVLLSCR